MIRRFGRSATARVREAAFAIGRPLRATRRSTTTRPMVLHGGFRRTGSTSIQALLNENADALAPYADLVTRKSAISTQMLARTSNEYTKRLEPRRRLQFEMALEAVASALRRTADAPTVLVSDENILATSVTSEVGDIFDMAVHALRLTREVWSDFDIQLVIYTRDRERWLESCYSQAISWHRCPEDRGTWMRRNGTCRDWEAGIAHMRQALDMPVTVLSMEEELAGDGPLGAGLLSVAGVPDEVIATLARPGRRNPSMGSAQLELMRQVNALGLSYGQTHKVSRIVRANPELFRQ